MRDWGLFEFFDEWRLAAEPDAVAVVLRDVERWPDWWPSVRGVTPLTGVDGTGLTWTFRFRTRLPYDMVFRTEVITEDPLVGVETRVTGRVDGHGRWRVTPIDGGTLVRFDWTVRAWLAWMRVVAPVARPVFRWNHRSLMTEGATGLARRLDTTLLADPAGGLLPARR